MKKSVIASLASVAIVGAAVGAYVWAKKKDQQQEEDDEVVNFISIQPEDESEETTEEEEGEEEEDPLSPEVREIQTIYPYLDPAFIEEQFNRNPEFDKEYPAETLINISHKASFGDEETMLQFIEIAEQYGYASEVLGEKQCTVSRKMFTEEGSILSDIYNIANQVVALEGQYEGYQID